MLKTVAIGILYAFLAVPSHAAEDPWQSLRFLIGTWEAKTQDGSAGASSTGTYSFSLTLQNHVLARHTAAGECKAPSDFNCAHNDLLYVYRRSTGAPLEAIYFDNEGHVIQYTVTTP